MRATNLFVKKSLFEAVNLEEFQRRRQRGRHRRAAAQANGMLPRRRETRKFLKMYYHYYDNMQKDTHRYTATTTTTSSGADSGWYWRACEIPEQTTPHTYTTNTHTHYLLAVQQKLRTQHSDKPTLYNTAADLPSRRASNLHLNAAYTDGWLCISTCTYLHIHSDYTAQKVYGRQERVRRRPAQPVHYLSKRNCNLLTTTRLPQCPRTHDIPTDTNRTDEQRMGLVPQFREQLTRARASERASGTIK